MLDEGAAAGARLIGGNTVATFNTKYGLITYRLPHKTEKPVTPKGITGFSTDK
ncbi:hypothetical protein [Lewinella sp. 4G2]|uniref:hypothetical protein n=1 Tax=Lewinella sp. 4G2 TaxID=1803372 RepID=UPI0012FB3D38|nr:hypothetical protein [Lewinella sp. 4G2]